MKIKSALFGVLFFGIISNTIWGQPEELNYTKTGIGDAVIFIPPFGCPADIWATVTDQLSNDFTCYTIEIPGFAGNEVKTDLDLDMFLTAIQRLIQKENLDNIKIVGHSFGGYLALNFAMKYQNKINKLIIVDYYPCPFATMNPGITEEKIKEQANQVKQMFESISDEQYLTAQKTNLQFAVTDSSDLEKLFQYYSDSDKGTLIKAQYSMLSSDLRDVISQIDTETFVIGTWIGMQEMGFTKEKVQENMKSQYAKMKNITFAFSDNAKHFIMLDNPEWLTQKIEDFLSND